MARPAKTAPADKPTQTKSVVYKFPKTIGACADHLFALKAKKSAAQKVVDAIEAEEKALREHLIQTLPKSEASGVSGKVANVKIVTKSVVQVKDWNAFYAYIKKNNAFELLQKRPSETAVAERWDNKKVVPGVEKFDFPVVSLTKA